MTGPALAKKSGPITISKNGSASKAMSPRSPASPINISARPAPSGSPVKVAPIVKTSTSVSMKKPSVTLKNPDTKPITKSTSDAKPETVKTTSTSISSTKSKPPPLKINIKAAETKGPQSPTTPKSASKTSTTSSVKSVATKSATLVKVPSTSSLSKSPSVSSLAAKTSVSKTAVSKSPSVSTAKPSTGSSIKSPLPTKSVSIVKSPTVVSKLSTTSTPEAKSTTVLKSSTPTSKTSVSVSKPVASKAPASPISTKTVFSKDTSLKSTVLSSKTVTGVKSPSTSTAKQTTLSRSSSIASSIKSVSPKPLASPSKPLSNATKSVSLAKTTAPSKTPTVTKSVTPKTLIKKEASTLSMISVKSSATIKSTSSNISRTSTLSPKSPTVKSTTSMSKTAVAPKSPLVKAAPTVANTIAPKSPAVKSTTLGATKTAVAPKSPVSKAAPTSAVSKTVAPKSPAIKATTTSVSNTSVAPKSPVTKAVPTTANITAPKSSAIKATTLQATKTVMAPKSPVAKGAPTAAVAKTAAPKSSAIKVAASSSAKTSTIVTKAVVSKTSAVKTPSSTVKNTPVRTPSSSSLSRTKSLSSSRLSSVSTESLASRTSLKSPISPRPISGVKNVAKTAKKVEEPKVKGIRGGQPVKKTIEIPGITELPSTKIIENNQNIQCCEETQYLIAENVQENNLEVNLETSANNEEIMSHEKSIEIIVEIDDLIPDIIENNLETIKEDSVEPMIVNMSSEESSLGGSCNSLDFEVVQIDDCQPRLNNITNSSDNCNIDIIENHFNATNEQVESESCVIEIEDQFETMNDKLILGDAPYETDSNKSDASDHEQSNLTESTAICDETNNEENIFSFPVDAFTNKIEENFVEKFMPEKLINQSEGPSSVSTEDSSLVSRKSYSEAVMGSTKDGEYYFDYDIDLADDCLDDEFDDDEKPVFVEVTEKEFPELKPKDLSGKRRRIRKQKKRNYSYRTESLSDSNLSTPEVEYNPEDFNGNEFCHYIKMMKDCSFYPNGTFSSDSVKLSTSESLTWLDISVRTTDDDLRPSTESLNTYEVFQASNLSKDFLTSIIGSTTTPTSTENWFWKSIESRHQTHCRANITLSLQPRPKHLTTPRFMTLLALISEAKGYKIEPSLSTHFITTDCFPRFNDKIKRLMVQGFWLIGRLITESLSEDEEVNCENPFEFIDGDIGYWWAGINMLDWQEYMKNCGKNEPQHNCYQFIVEDMEEYKHFRNEAISSMGTSPEEFMSEFDVENFIHTVRNVKYYCDNYFVESQENLEALNESCDNESLVEWENNSK
ncbi:serine-rich adhesin for platelets-like [Daktulosphaira vitifoliae]|uniref:serine-rich adhesin for platelets-like n=1 Tax=Daktulosphaira vitifoliae TaxID=58002 RepID=UPI0021A9E19F|nr:serine-rich adhesin for platelets-like [Daktulosphaira vitifoliae]